MRPFSDLVAFNEAFEQALDLAIPVRETEVLELAAAAGRVVAGPVLAPVAVPPSDRAAMDGYALRAEDLAGAEPGGVVELDCIAQVLAGAMPTASVEAGKCVEIATGAPLPDGADTVVPVEQTTRTGEKVTFSAPARAGHHIVARGADIDPGDLLVPQGARANPSLIAALAAAGVDAVEVWRRPRVLILPTGDELAPLGQPLQPAQVYDSNSAGLAALLQENGAEVERGEIVGDASEALRAQLGRSEFDLTITLGGTSVGRHDLVTDVVGEMGEVLVHGVAVKPGKPLLLARIEGRAIVGLPGFPTSCLLLAYRVVEPMVRRMARLEGGNRKQQRVEIAEDIRSPAGKHQLLTVRIDGGMATSTFRTSSTITSMSHAAGWIEIDAAVDLIPAGSAVEVTLF
jgi:molybdopterin molybdotransferase